MLTALLGLNDRRKILNLLEDRDFSFPKHSNMLLPGTVWRCAAFGWSAHRNDAENPPVGPAEAQAAGWCALSVPCAAARVTPPTCSAAHSLRTSEAPQQRYCRLPLIAGRLPASWEFLFYRFLKTKPALW